MIHGQCKQYTLRDIKVKPNMYIECSIFSNKIARHFHILSLHQTIPYIYWTVLIQDSASCLEKIFIIACIFFLAKVLELTSLWSLTASFICIPTHLFFYFINKFTPQEIEKKENNIFRPEKCWLNVFSIQSSII